MTTYEKFIEAIERPRKNADQARADLVELREQVRAAEQDYSTAEAAGQASTKLYNSWQDLRADLERAEAKCKALQNAKPGDEALRIARQLSKENTEQVRISQEQKELVMKDLHEAYDNYFHQVLKVEVLNDQQKTLAEQVRQANRLFREIPIIKLSECITPLHTLPQVNAHAIREAKQSQG